MFHLPDLRTLLKMPVKGAPAANNDVPSVIARPAKPRREVSRRVREERMRRKQRTAIERRRKLQEFLTKAGFSDANVDVLTRRVFALTVGMTGFIWLLTTGVAIANETGPLDLLVLSFGIWTAIFAFVYIFLFGAIYFFLEMRIYRRTKELEDVLPDFLQLASANISAGMPIDRALWLAIRPNFGVLAKEIEDVAKSTLSGDDLATSLRALVGRYDSVILKRSIAILIEGFESGGELADLLSKIALNIQELKIMRKEMASSVTTYAIFISFASIVVAPILFALATQLIAIIVGITMRVDFSQMSTGFSFNPVADASMIDDFRIYCFVTLSITATMSALLLAVIKHGKVREGVKDIPFFVLVALGIYLIASHLLGTLLAGVISF